MLAFQLYHVFGMSSAKYQATETRDLGRGSEVRELICQQHDVDRLLMISEALWNFLQKQHGYTDDDLVKAVGTIDLRNSKANKDAQEKCLSCGRMVSAYRRLVHLLRQRRSRKPLRARALERRPLCLRGVNDAGRGALFLRWIQSPRDVFQHVLKGHRCACRWSLISCVAKLWASGTM